MDGKTHAIALTTATSGGQSGFNNQFRANGLNDAVTSAAQWASQLGNSYNAANEQTDAGNTGSFLSGNYSVTTGSGSGRVVDTGDSRDSGESSDSDDWGSSGRNLAAFYTPAGGEETSQAETGAGGNYGSSFEWDAPASWYYSPTPTSTTTPPTFTDTSGSYMGGGGQLGFVQAYDLTSVHPLLGQSDLLPVTPGQFLGPSEIQAIATAPTPGTTSPPPVNFQTLESRGQLPNDALETGIGRMSADEGNAVVPICFAGNQLVHGSTGWEAIADMRPNERLWAVPENDPQAEPVLKRVLRTFSNGPGALLNIHVGDQVLRPTHNHRFWVASRGWTRADELRPGDLLRSLSGELVAVTDLFDNGDVEPVFNLEVEDHHTYFVSTPDRRVSVLVHNDECAPASGPVTDPDPSNRSNHVFKQNVTDPDGVVRTHVFYVNTGPFGWDSAPVDIGVIDSNGKVSSPLGKFARTYADVQANAGASVFWGASWEEFFSKKGLQKGNLGQGGTLAGSGGAGVGDNSDAEATEQGAESAATEGEAAPQRFEQISKHRPGGSGSPGLLSDADALKAVNQAKEIKPGLRAIKLQDGRVAVFRSASKKPGTFGFDLWHGGWEANAEELREIANTILPVFVP